MFDAGQVIGVPFRAVGVCEMASLEKAERIGGVGLLGVPTFDFFVWALDNYARGELLMNLRAQLPPWLLNPVFVFVCMWGGLGLLYLSHQHQLRRILAQPSPLVDVEQYRSKERPGWLGPLLWVTLGALVAAPILALAYSLAYQGSMPLVAHLNPPPICKTADCFPSAPKPKVKIDSPMINAPNCPNGICPTAPNFGTQTVNNGPPPLKLEYSFHTLLSDEKATFGFDRNKCPVVTHMRIVPNQSVAPPISVALDFDQPVTEIGTTIESIGGIMGGGPFTVGTHAVSSPISPGIGPHHALIVEVCSAVPVKLTSDPHLVD